MRGLVCCERAHAHACEGKWARIVARQRLCLRVHGGTWNSVTNRGNWNCVNKSLFINVSVNEVSR